MSDNVKFNNDFKSPLSNSKQNEKGNVEFESKTSSIGHKFTIREKWDNFITSIANFARLIFSKKPPKAESNSLNSRTILVDYSNYPEGLKKAGSVLSWDAFDDTRTEFKDESQQRYFDWTLGPTQQAPIRPEHKIGEIEDIEDVEEIPLDEENSIEDLDENDDSNKSPPKEVFQTVKGEVTIEWIDEEEGLTKKTNLEKLKDLPPPKNEPINPWDEGPQLPKDNK